MGTLGAKFDLQSPQILFWLAFGGLALVVLDGYHVAKADRANTPGLGRILILIIVAGVLVPLHGVFLCVLSLKRGWVRTACSLMAIELRA
jgi:hypothetical protein